MTTYYSNSGFILLIDRASGSLFSGEIYRDAILTDSFTSGSSQLIFYLNSTGEHTFVFQNGSPTDPVKFEVYNYETIDLIGTITFPLDSPLILKSGIDGESDKNLSIEYPLKTFSFANPENINLQWLCLPWSPDCEGLEISANALPEPKIIGNLSGCSNESYQGDTTQGIVCDNETSGQYYLFSIYSEGELLYSRLECCCPTVAPDNNPPIVVGFVCTCPDWGRATSYNQTLFNSSVKLENWVRSNAGAKGDCKHIMAAKRIMGIEQPIYTDPPYSAPPPPPTPG